MPRWLTELMNVALVVSLVGAVGLLPPDTSLAQVQERGSLRVCVPNEYPPLVTNDPEAPGIDIEVLQRVAEALDVRLRTETNSRIGRDFNPRNWRITRAQCEIIGGGVVVAGITTSFLETTRPHLTTGWALVVPPGMHDARLEGASVGFLSSHAGLDRIALSRYLRDIAGNVTVLQGEAQARSALVDADIEFLATEALQAQRLAQSIDAQAQFLPNPLERYPLGFGLWKGDLTLKRAIDAAMQELRASGALDEIIRRYDLQPVSDTCTVCP